MAPGAGPDPLRVGILSFVQEGELEEETKAVLLEGES